MSSLLSPLLQAAGACMQCYSEPQAKVSTGLGASTAFEDMKDHLFPSSLSGLRCRHCIPSLNACSRNSSGRWKKLMPTKSDLKSSSFFLACVKTTWSSLIMGLFLLHFPYVCLLMTYYNTSDQSQNQRTLNLKGLLTLEMSDIPAHLRISPWLNAFTLPLPGVHFTLSLAYRMKSKLFSPAQHPLHTFLTSVPLVDSMTQLPIHRPGYGDPRPHSFNSTDHPFFLLSPSPARNLLFTLRVLFKGCLPLWYAFSNLLKQGKSYSPFLYP